MGPLIRLIFVGLIVLVPYPEVFLQAAEDTGVPVGLLVSQCYEENKSLDSFAVSYRGCRGLCQICEKTWREFGTDDFDDAFDPRLNIVVQAKYMEWLRKLMENEGIWDEDYQWSLLAYLWGPTMVIEYLQEDGEWLGLYWVVTDYVENILANSKRVVIIQPQPTPEGNIPSRLERLR